MSTPNIVLSLPCPSGSGTPATTTFPLTPTLINSILNSPSSQYSKLANTISHALSASPSSSSSASSTTTISLPSTLSLHPHAVQVLLSFLESGPSVYSPASNEFRARVSEVELVKRDDVRRVFVAMGVAWPWSATGGGGEFEVSGLGDEYVRDVGDYSSPEVYEALREQVQEELFNVVVETPGGGQGGVGRNVIVVSGESSVSTGSNGNSDFLSSPPPPSYEQSTSSSPSAYPSDIKKSHQSATGTTFCTTLTTSVSTHLHSLILKHLQPSLHEQARRGMFKGSYILLVSSPNSPQPRENDITTSHPNHTDYKSIIYLPEYHPGVGEGFTMEFLVQEQVMEGIKKAVEEAVGIQPSSNTPAAPPAPPPPPARHQKAKSGLSSGWLKSLLRRPKDPTEEANYIDSIHGRVTSAPILPPLLNTTGAPQSSETKIDVSVQDVWIRRETEVGLIETEQLKGVVVWVQVGKGYGGF